MWEANAKSIPSPTEIFDQTLQQIGLSSKDSVTWFRSNFEEALTDIMGKGWDILKPYQSKAQTDFLLEIWKRNGPAYQSRAQEIIQDSMMNGLKPQEQVLRIVSEFLQDIPPEATTISQKSITNQSKKRAGVMMEKALAFLFEKCEIPFEQQRPKKTDFCFPDIRTYNEYPERAVLVSAKTSLAERWREVVGEIESTGRNVFLLTLDQKHTESRLEDIASHGIFTYIVDSEYLKFNKVKNVRPVRNLVGDISRVCPTRPIADARPYRPQPNDYLGVQRKQSKLV